MIPSDTHILHLKSSLTKQSMLHMTINERQYAAEMSNVISKDPLTETTCESYQLCKYGGQVFVPAINKEFIRPIPALESDLTLLLSFNFLLTEIPYCLNNSPVSKTSCYLNLNHKMYHLYWILNAEISHFYSFCRTPFGLYPVQRIRF